MSRLDEVAERDGWRCWLCDEAVDPTMSVNDPRGPSVDSLNAGGNASKSTKGTKGTKTANAARSGRSRSPNEEVDPGERLAHRGCNTKKGAVKPVVPWPARLFVSDPAPLIAVSARLQGKGGREVVARCPTQADADETARWLIDRFSRLVPGLEVNAGIEPGGGQFLVALSAPRP